MEPTNVISPVDDFQQLQAPACPLCGDEFLLLHDQWRCRRCHFLLCESCEGPSDSE